MANYKGNRFPIWAIEVDGTVVAYDAMASRNQMSEAGFASSIAISVDGTVWAVTFEPDPDGGGQKVYYSDGSSNWTEITGKCPGAVAVAGTAKGDCVIITNDYQLYALDQDNSYLKLDKDIFDIDCGAGKFWALKPLKEGGIPVLQFCVATTPLKWTAFEGNLTPTSISVGTSGECWALIDGVPYHFKLDGKTKQPVIPGAKLNAIQISYKDYTNAILSGTDITEKGNLFLQYNSSPRVEPSYLPVKGIRASSMLTSYYVP